MPIPTEYEVLRLNIIANNHRRIQEALQHTDSVYAALNKQALLDAALHSTTGRVSSPSPQNFSDSELEVVVLSSVSARCASENAKEVSEGICRCNQPGLHTAKIQEHLTSQKMLAQFHSEPQVGKAAPNEQQRTKTKSTEETESLSSQSEDSVQDSDSDFILSKAEEDKLSTLVSTSSGDVNTEEEPSAPSERFVVHLASDSMQAKTAVAKDKMVTRLKASDLPEPWFPQQKANQKTNRQKRTLTEVTVLEHSTTQNVVEDPVKRGRGRPKAKGKVVDAKMGNKRAKRFSSSTVDVLMGRSGTPVQDVDKLRQKREADAVAYGRTVRTIYKPAKLRTSPMAMTGVSSGGDCSKDAATPFNLKGRGSLQNLSPMSTTAGEREDDKVVQEDGVPFFEGLNDDPGAPLLQRPGKEVIAYDVQTPVAVPKVAEDICFGKSVEGELQSDLDLKGKHERRRVRSHRRFESPPRNYSNDHYQGRAVRRSESPREGWRSYQERLVQFTSGSPQKNWSRGNCVQETRSPRRSHSRSPDHWRERGHDRRGKRITDQYEDNCIVRKPYYEYQNSLRFSAREGQHREHNDLSSPESGHRHRRYNSPERGLLLRRRSCTPYSSRSPPKMSAEAVQARGREWPRSTSLQDEGIQELLPAMDRKQRRQRQALRESEKSRRQKDGKKPFYLTLDGDGRPYGPGKPSWVAEINKLASGLDPSCTHIRKQTFEGIQTLKDRLNENFEYSGTLNEDYLRGLMGRAVTKRRGELISLIKNNGTQPLHIDHEVWRRLKQLAHSKQREDKSEQGRYANACRKTVGRTGSIGVNGVREKLRSLLRRSPHPDEVEDEVQRDKGYGGQRKSRATISDKVENNCSAVLLLLDNCSFEEHGHHADRIPSDTDSDHHYRWHGRHLPEKSRRSPEYGIQKMDVIAGSTGIGYNGFGITEREMISTDDYIEKLEAEIKRLQAKTAKASTSSTFVASQSIMSTRNNSMEGPKEREG